MLGQQDPLLVVVIVTPGRLLDLVALPASPLSLGKTCCVMLSQQALLLLMAIVTPGRPLHLNDLPEFPPVLR